MPLKDPPKLGKKPARHDPRTLHLREFLREDAMPAIPVAHRSAPRVKRWPALGNKKIQDCTCAAAGHLIHMWTARTGPAVVLPTRTIVRAYAKISGYNPRTRENDEGVGVLDALKFWRKTGFNNHRISAFVSLDRHHSLHVKTGVYLFGGVYVGLGLPRSAHGQRIWEVPTHGPTGDGAPDSWGGHVVPVIGYDEHFLTVVTWGRLQRMTWGFWRTYCDEAYAILSQDLMDGHETDAQGLDVPALRRALSALG